MKKFKSSSSLLAKKNPISMIKTKHIKEKNDRTKHKRRKRKRAKN